MRTLARALVGMLGAGMCLLAGCNQNMDDQYRRDAYEAAPHLPGGTASVRPPAGTLAQGALRQALPGAVPESIPLPISQALLERARERYAIYCTPCHGQAGYGDGMVVQRGFPAPPSYHEARLRGAPDRHFYDVISGGYGAMYSYAARVAPDDRWAIVAWIRTLQLSQHAPADVLPATLREALP